MEEQSRAKKVLVITYYWPPSGGAGVQRWLQFTKYLPDLGWDPIVFTPENPDFDLVDSSLLQYVHPKVDVLKFPIWEPYGLFKRLSGTKELKQGQILEEKRGLFKKISVFARGNFFVPDPKIFWVKPSVAFLKDMIIKNDIHHIITTGPPHSLHLIGLQLKQHMPSIHWLADFRDPWTEWDIMRQFKMLPRVWKRHQKLEKEVLKSADITIATGNQAAQDLQKLGARKTVVLTNGYHSERELKLGKSTNLDGSVLLHLGMLNEKRVPSLFFKIFDQNWQGQRFIMQFTGIISPDVLKQIASLEHLPELCAIKDSVNHQDLKEEYSQSDFLLLLQTNSSESSTQLPGKLFEYLAQKKPILAFGDPESDAARILNECNCGIMLAYDDEVGTKHVVEQLLGGTFGQEFTYEGIGQYSRQAITGQLADLLASL